ncbi:MAG: hypothetical protein WC835_03290 [Candidatus Paceibacterota bacterium]|jgi:hypothetical protein
MKKQLFLLVSIALLLPSITYAAWWNPLTWFKKKETPSISQKVNVATSSITTTINKEAKQKEEKIEQKNSKELSVNLPKKQTEIFNGRADKIKEQGILKTEAKEEPKTITLPSGAIVEIGIDGSVIRTLKEVPITSNAVPQQQISLVDISAISGTQQQRGTAVATFKLRNISTQRIVITSIFFQFVGVEDVTNDLGVSVIDKQTNTITADTNALTHYYAKSKALIENMKLDHPIILNELDSIVLEVSIWNIKSSPLLGLKLNSFETIQDNISFNSLPILQWLPINYN